MREFDFVKDNEPSVQDLIWDVTANIEELKLELAKVNKELREMRISHDNNERANLALINKVRGL